MQHKRCIYSSVSTSTRQSFSWCLQASCSNRNSPQTPTLNLWRDSSSPWACHVPPQRLLHFTADGKDPRAWKRLSESPLCIQNSLLSNCGYRCNILHCHNIGSCCYSHLTKTKSIVLLRVTQRARGRSGKWSQVSWPSSYPSSWPPSWRPKIFRDFFSLCFFFFLFSECIYVLFSTFSVQPFRLEA